jgi:hypothetical protein
MNNTITLEYNSENNTSYNDLRSHLVKYYQHNNTGPTLKYKPMCFFDNNHYYGLNLNNIEIKADTKLSCIITFYDYLNEKLFSKDNLNCYDNDFFYEVVAPSLNLPLTWDYSLINNEFIFNRPDIHTLIDTFINEAFENDTLWFEEI